MRILHLSKFYPPDPGGLEHVVARLGVAVVRVPTYGVWWLQPLARGYVTASRWPADVVYVHRPHPWADLAALVGPRRPTIVLHHSDVQRQRVARLLYQPLARAMARRAAVSVVATSAQGYAPPLDADAWERQVDLIEDCGEGAPPVGAKGETPQVEVERHIPLVYGRGGEPMRHAVPAAHAKPVRPRAGVAGDESRVDGEKVPLAGVIVLDPRKGSGRAEFVGGPIVELDLQRSGRWQLPVQGGQDGTAGSK